MRWIESTMIIKFLCLTQCDSNLQNGWLLGASLCMQWDRICIVESPYFIAILFSTYNVDVRIIMYMYAKIISIDVQYPNKLLHNDT